jgi:hypothetical protein
MEPGHYYPLLIYKTVDCSKSFVLGQINSSVYPFILNPRYPCWPI